MPKRRCKLKTRMWGPPTQAQRAFNGQAPDGKGGYLRNQDLRRDKLPPVPVPFTATQVAQMVQRLEASNVEVLIVCTACHATSPDEGQRCCPKCRCPGWRGERPIENYPAQEGVKGCACQDRMQAEPYKISRERG